MDVVTFGEIMLRLSPVMQRRIVQAERFQAFYGGAEANVAVSLAMLGGAVSFVSKVPDNAIGSAAVNELRRYGVDTRFILRGGERLGIYFCEPGAGRRPSQVTYDRGHSAIADADAGEFDWEGIFRGARWFHLSGVTPALSPGLRKASAVACRMAKRLGLTVSLDLNYRSSLWTRAEANAAMTELCPLVDVCIANEEDVYDIFGLKAGKSDVVKGILDVDGYAELARAMTGRFGFRKVAFTLRTSLSADDNIWSALMFAHGDVHTARSYPIHIVDRVGGGDAFAAGLIFSLLGGWDDREALEFATAAGCLKHTIVGDMNLVTVDEVHRLMNGDASGRIVR